MYIHIMLYIHIKNDNAWSMAWLERGDRDD